MPQRHSELAGQLLSGALEQAEQSGSSPRAVLNQRAYQFGKQLGEAARSDADDRDAQQDALRILETQGFQPRVEDDGIILRNCPFHTLAQEYTELVCGMNLSLLDGLLDGLTTTGLAAHLDPAPSRCCVRLAPRH